MLVNNWVYITYLANIQSYTLFNVPTSLWFIYNWKNHIMLIYSNIKSVIPKHSSNNYFSTNMIIIVVRKELIKK